MQLNIYIVSRKIARLKDWESGASGSQVREIHTNLMTQMPAAFCPATCENFVAAYSALASEEAVLSFTLPLGWLVLSSACAMAGLDHDWAERRGWRRSQWRRAKKGRAREREEMDERRRRLEGRSPKEHIGDGYFGWSQ